MRPARNINSAYATVAIIFFKSLSGRIESTTSERIGKSLTSHSDFSFLRILLFHTYVDSKTLFTHASPVNRS